MYPRLVPEKLNDKERAVVGAEENLFQQVIHTGVTKLKLVILHCYI
jgi:hypothetical protein